VPGATEYAMSGPMVSTAVAQPLTVEGGRQFVLPAHLLPTASTVEAVRPHAQGAMHAATDFAQRFAGQPKQSAQVHPMKQKAMDYVDTLMRSIGKGPTDGG